MKKSIIAVLVIIITLIIIGGVAFYARDSFVFDIFFSEEQKNERDLNRMAKLYPEKIDNFSLYSWSAEKIRKDSECGEINEILNNEGKEIKGEICTRTTIGQYRDSNNNAIFVHLVKISKGRDDPGIDYLFEKISQTKDKLESYNIIRPENHEIGWFPMKNFGIYLVLTQEGIARKEPDGGESMLYQNKATGNNPVTQYFLTKFQNIF